MCDGYNHPLIEIQRKSDHYGIESVVRWCPDCGAIVVDGEMDGRVQAGQVMKMKFPTST
jgi:valyl-tRNA synthetase